MELFRVGEMLFRSSLLPHLAPAARRLPQTDRAAATSVARHCTQGQRHRQNSRLFSATHSPRDQVSATTDQARDSPSASKNFPSTSPSSRGPVNNNLSSLLDDTLNFKKGTPTAPSSRTSHFSSRDAQANNPSSRGYAREMGAVKPANDMVDTLIGNIGRSRTNQQNRATQTGASMSQMLDPFGYLSRQANRAPEIDDRPIMKLGPKVGRTVQVDTARNMDVGRAFRSLDLLCTRNRVRRDFYSQRFHERPGLKRKRLKSERWRRNFKNQFKATVRMVQRMKNQGW